MKSATIFAVGVLSLAGCTSSSTSDLVDTMNEDTTLTFSVGGTATQASITWLTDGFGTSQETSASVPWTKTETYKSGTMGVNINAQNAGGGTITCKITDASGKVLAQNESSGDYAVVSCAVG